MTWISRLLGRGAPSSTSLLVRQQQWARGLASASRLSATAEAGTLAGGDLARGAAGWRLTQLQEATAPTLASRLAAAWRYRPADPSRGLSLFHGWTGLMLAEDLEHGYVSPSPMDTWLLEQAQIQQAAWDAEPGRPLQCDLILGATGVILALWPRRALPEAQRALIAWGTLVAHWLDWTGPTPAGGASRPEIWPPWRRTLHPQGGVDVGLAHGVWGPLIAVGLLQHAGWLPSTHGTALVEWLRTELADRAPTEWPTTWAIATRSWDDAGSARQAWCYGPPGAAVALWQLGHLRADPTLTAWSTRLAVASAELPRRRTGIRDSTICHGDAGTAVLWHWMGQRVSDPSARTTLQRATQLHLDALHDAGETPEGWYPRHHNPTTGGWETAPDDGWLEGVLGVLQTLRTLEPQIAPHMAPAPDGWTLPLGLVLDPAGVPLQALPVRPSASEVHP